MLIATYPILLGNTQFKPGDILPATDAALVKAWLEAGTAKIEGESEPEQEAEPAIKAKTSRKTSK